MAFGRNKKKGSGAEAPAEVNDAQAASGVVKQKKRKSAELLSSVVNESATGAAIDLMKQNKPFALPNGTSWVGLLLSADEIGGLSQKQKGDATKGSIIELIAADKIQVVATKAMLDEEFLGIVPSEESLRRMEEYSLLTDAAYYWAVYRSENNGQSLAADAVQGTPASYADARAVQSGEKALSELLPEVWLWAGGLNEPVLSVNTPVEAELALVGAQPYSDATSAPAADSDPLSDAFGFGDDDGVDYSALADEDTDADAEPQFDLAPFEAQFDDVTPSLEDDESSLDVTWQSDDVDLATGEVFESDDEAAAGYYQYIEENRDRVVDEQEVRDTIARRFLSNDLDLVVDLEEFNRTFATDAPAISIEVAEDASDWLGSQVAQLSRQANAEIARLHQANADELRVMFVETAALHVENTMSIVSTDVPGSQYHTLMAASKADFEAQRAAAPQEISARRRELTSAFEAAADIKAAQAAAHARANYEDKNRPKLERDLAEVGLDLDRRHEEQYAHDRGTVLEMRRKDANVRMDIGTNRIFELLHERQIQQRESERELLEHWNEELTRFIDENRKGDIARAMALTEQLARDTALADLKAENRSRLQDLRAEHAERERRLTEELTRNREEALGQLNGYQSQWNSNIALEQERTRAQSAVATQLTAQLNSLGAEYRAQYEGKINSLEADKQSYAQDLERAHVTQKRANSIMIALLITVTVAALLVGVIAGWSIAGAQTVTTGSAPAGFAVLGSFLTGPTAWSGS
ncbi:MAG: hypothetical protein ABWX92_04505 [Mycetocola sp.]